ncbi:hypothetical protein BU23DRAFT_570847 [Bimuria novae-zelandiae CBS 107.79]|uniref:Uncharacterized protein n=1 Tax=Bimuria novae-zelandiae CBS 107.79 TaxID=1447943 RepID=A0A6A5V0Q8_9PLEO|nr:hypothetical protein BU23DRAFT_570847 [Bimuria novae-zelandiae CBS 107.79]
MALFDKAEWLNDSLADMQELTRLQYYNMRPYQLAQIPLGHYCKYKCRAFLSAFCCSDRPQQMEYERHKVLWQRLVQVPLTDGFARGWAKLPNELKMAIFSLIAGDTSPCSFDAPVEQSRSNWISQCIIHFAIYSPESQSLAELTFYTQHHLKLHSNFYRAPPLNHLHHLRLLYDTISLGDVSRAQQLLIQLQSNKWNLRLKRLVLHYEFELAYIRGHELPIKWFLQQRYTLLARSGAITTECSKDPSWKDGCGCEGTARYCSDCKLAIWFYERWRNVPEKNITII